MGRISLEFGRKGTEGINEEPDENIEDLLEDTGDGPGITDEEDIDIKRILDEGCNSDDELVPAKKDFLDELSKLMNDDEEIDEYYDGCIKEKILEDSQKDIDK